MRRMQRPLIFLLSWVSAALATGGPSLAEPPAFKVYVEDAGAYRIAFEDLAAAGLVASGVASDGIGLTHLGEPVPIWIEDSGDGRFEPGDRIEFLGEHLPGETSYLNEHTRHNVYRLRLDAAGPARMKPRRPTVTRRPASKTHELRREQHLEEDLLLIRLPGVRGNAGEGDAHEEGWYWAKLVRGHEPVVRKIDLADWDPRSRSGADLKIHLRGWTRPRGKGDAAIPDHQVDVSLNGHYLRTVEWNGQEPHLVELSGLAAKLFVQGENRLELAVPKRQQEDGEALVDVVLLNWIEASYSRISRIGERQVRVSLADPAEDTEDPRVLGLSSEAAAELLVYGESGWRASSREAEGKPNRKKRYHLAVRADAGESVFTASRAVRLERPALVTLDRPSRWADPVNRADYVMIVHRRFEEAIEPLAELHRRRGLEVAVVDVEDVFDEFNHGIAHPKALRDFLDHAYHHWAKPAPRFVLLVGDASWDTRNETAVDENYADWTARPYELERFAKNGSTPYPEDAELNHRQFVPTATYETYEGHAASDNFFVLVDGDDELPDMAIGRFPVAEPAEVAQIVAKTLHYVEQPEAGPWQRRALFITNEEPSFQRQSDRVAEAAAAAGYVALKVYPASTESSNEHHTERLIEAFDEGALLVHFYGHGGRYIWRTGPPDLEKNHDLLTLDHLDQLHPTGRLPVVLSLTCYSAPFDHPNADSIGEKLLRIPDRGAVAVIAASWRNSPSPQWGKTLLEELTAPGATVGEALLRAKRRLAHPLFVHTYNLLGDPAVPVALPESSTEVASR